MFNFEMGGWLIQRVIPKTYFFGPENRGRLIHRSAYTPGFTVQGIV